MDVEEDEELPNVKWFIFLSYVALLSRKIFDEGFPIRGGIDYGSYFIDKANYSLAGKPIVKTFKLAHELELSGCVLTAEAAERFFTVRKRIREKGESFCEDFVLPYKVPMKGKIERKMLMLNWYRPYDSWPGGEADIRGCVIQSFQDHNKYVDESVKVKIDNTELSLRYALSLTWKNSIEHTEDRFNLD